MITVIEEVASFLVEARRLAEADEDLRQLIIKASEKDQAAFSRLYSMYSKMMTIIARRHAKGRAVNDIDDIVQDVFVKFYEKELPKFAQLMQMGQRTPDRLRPTLLSATKNATVDANRKSGFHGSFESPMGGFDPTGQGKLSGEQLGDRAKKVVRAAYKRALAKAQLDVSERKFITLVFGSVEFKAPKPGEITNAARKAWPVTQAGNPTTKEILNQKANRVKTKFLKFFCTDKELCALLPHFKGLLGRARDKSKVLTGLGAGNACKDHACEELTFLSDLGEDTASLDQAQAQDVVLSWIAENLPKD